jgi:hypothetical protein
MNFKTGLAVVGLLLPLTACNGGLQNTLNAHPAPRPVTPTTVASVAMAISSPLNVNANGSYTVALTLKDSSGAVIPAGTTLANSISLTTNDSSSVGLELTTGASVVATPVVSISTAQPQFYIVFTQCTTAPCPAANAISLTATATGIATPTTIKLGSATVVPTPAPVQSATPTPVPSASPVPSPLPSTSPAPGAIVLDPAGTASNPFSEPIFGGFTLTASEVGYSGNFTATTDASACFQTTSPTSTNSFNYSGSLTGNCSALQSIVVTDTNGHSATTVILPF